MPLHFTKADQPALLALAMGLTDSTGFHSDAIAFGARRAPGGDIRAVAVFQDFRAGEAEFHFGVDAPHMTKGVIEGVKAIAFHPQMLGLSRLWAIIAADNASALRSALGVGFEFEFRKRGGFRGGKDAIVLSMAAAGPRT